MDVQGNERFHRSQAGAFEDPHLRPAAMLGYADFPQGRMQAYWLASFKTSPTDFLSECIVQIKNGDIPVDDLDLRHSLINVYSELTETYEQKNKQL